MMALLSLIGSAGAGKILGLVTEYFSAKHQKDQDNAEREFQRSLADKGQLKDYLTAVHSSPEGKPSLLSYTLCSLYIMFGLTACACCIYCFYVAFGEVTIKDPDQKESLFRIPLLFETRWTPETTIDLSPMGLGYLILHPLLFILSMVSTGTRPNRR